MSQGLSEAVHAGRRRLLKFADALDLQEALSPRVQWLLCFLLLVILPTRRPGLFLHANFYAEDGNVWYAQAYSGGWLHSLTLPQAGYLQTLQRLLTGFALLVPFHLAPIVDAIAGLLFQVLPVSILLSRRCRNWSPLSVRCLFAGLYAFFPNGSETHVVLTNSQWHLALMLPLLAFAEPPKTRLGKIVDLLFFLFAGFCGPFGILLIPVMFLFWVCVRSRTWVVMEAGCVAGGSLIQLYELFHGPARYHAYLGATLSRFLHIVGAEVILGSIIGGHHQIIHTPAVLIGLALVIGTLFLVYCLLFSPLSLRLFLLYAALMLGVALHDPLVSGPKPLWDLLIDDVICRYWFMPGLAFLWGAAWCARCAPSPFMRHAGEIIVILTCLGSCISWRYKPFQDLNFPVHAREFDSAPVGTSVRIPIYPGDGHVLILVKR